MLSAGLAYMTSLLIVYFRPCDDRVGWGSGIVDWGWGDGVWGGRVLGVEGLGFRV